MLEKLPHPLFDSDDKGSSSFDANELAREAGLYAAIHDHLEKEGYSEQILANVNVDNLEELIETFPDLVDGLLADPNIQQYLPTDDND